MGQHRFFWCPKRGLWTTCRRNLCGLDAGIAVPLIAELAQHPGARDGPQFWQRTDHQGVRVQLKTRFQLATWALMVAITATLAATEAPMAVESRRWRKAGRHAAMLGSRGGVASQPITGYFRRALRFLQFMLLRLGSGNVRKTGKTATSS